MHSFQQQAQSIIWAWSLNSPPPNRHILLIAPQGLQLRQLLSHKLTLSPYSTQTESFWRWVSYRLLTIMEDAFHDTLTSAAPISKDGFRWGSDVRENICWSTPAHSSAPWFRRGIHQAKARPGALRGSLTEGFRRYRIKKNEQNKRIRQRRSVGSVRRGGMRFSESRKITVNKLSSHRSPLSKFQLSILTGNYWAIEFVN